MYHNYVRVVKFAEAGAEAGDSPEVCQRSFAALRMTQPQAVILSAAKDLWCALVHPASRGLADFWGITRKKLWKTVL